MKKFLTLLCVLGLLCSQMTAQAVGPITLDKNYSTTSQTGGGDFTYTVPFEADWTVQLAGTMGGSNEGNGGSAYLQTKVFRLAYNEKISWHVPVRNNNTSISGTTWIIREGQDSSVILPTVEYDANGVRSTVWKTWTVPGGAGKLNANSGRYVVVPNQSIRSVQVWKDHSNYDQLYVHYHEKPIGDSGLSVTKPNDCYAANGHQHNWPSNCPTKRCDGRVSLTVSGGGGWVGGDVGGNGNNPIYIVSGTCNKCGGTMTKTSSTAVYDWTTVDCDKTVYSCGNPTNKWKFACTMPNGAVCTSKDSEGNGQNPVLDSYCPYTPTTASALSSGSFTISLEELEGITMSEQKVGPDGSATYVPDSTAVAVNIYYHDDDGGNSVYICVLDNVLCRFKKH